MRTTIERVRAAVVAGAALVALVVAGFLFMAHYKAHRLLRDLPARLGADIQKETNGFTWSQSVKGRTVFTIHAAKATQHKDGRTGLEDVGIVLYGEKDGRADRIYGKQFDYDQKNGIVRAIGEVQLDLQAPAPVSATARTEFARGGKTPQTPAKGDSESQPIHAVTSGLVFVQSLGVASTDQPIRFEYRGMTGQARGAAYNSDTGVTTLESEVRLSALRDGRPTVLTAGHAEMDRAQHRMTLRGAHYVSLAKDAGDKGASETMTAGTMVVHLAEGGGIERAEGSDGVEVASAESRLQAPHGVIRVHAQGRPEVAQMTGGVRFASDRDKPGTASDALAGTAAMAVAHFDDRGEIETVRLTGGVQAQLQGAASAPRTMRGGEMDLQLAGEADGSRRWVQQATLRGDAQVQSVLPAVAGHTAGSEEMRAEVLVSRWQQERGAAVLRSIHGEGKTEVRRTRDGADEVSRGDRLEAEFGPGAGVVGAEARMGITTATQQGNVRIERVVKKAGGASAATQTTRGRAERVLYDAASGHVSLTGEPEVSDDESVVRAERITLTESSGDAEAAGAVQVTYRRAAGKEGGTADGVHAEDRQEPIHAVAERAELRKQTGGATFFGTATMRARLWQGGSQVEAPVLVFARNEATLDAYGAAASEALPVRTVLVSKAGTSTNDASGAAGGVKERPQVIRVQSGRLHYAESARRAEFSKGVVLDDADGMMTSRTAVALLAAAPALKTGEGVGGEGARARAAGPAGSRSGQPGALSAGLPGGGLERVTATGDVVVRQPGRVATGQQAVYTASDGEFVLTGGGGVLPKVTDAVNGSVTGAALRFRSGDNSVTVEGRAKDGAPATGDGRVHTRTRVKQ